MPKATGSAPIVSPPIAVGLGRDDLERGVGHEQDAVGPARRLLGVEEPRAALTGLEREVTPLHGCARARDGGARRGPSSATVPGPRRGGLAGPDPRRRYGARRAAPHLHRAPAGRHLRRPPGRRPGRRAPRLRRLLPLRPLPGDGRARDGLPGPDRRLDHAGRAGPRHVHDPPRHARHVGDVPLPRSAGDHRGRGRPDERRPRRARPRCRLVRGRAPGLRHPVPALGERFDRLEEQLAIITGLWATPVGERFSFTGRHYAGHGLAGACPSPCSSPRPPIIVGGNGPTRTPRARRPLRRPSSTWPSRRSTGVRRAVRARARAACEAIDRDPGLARVLRRARRCAAAPTRPSSRGGRPPSAASPTSCASTAPPDGPTRWRPPSTAGGDAGRRAASTCRCSTSPTSSTSSWSPPRWRAQLP